LTAKKGTVLITKSCKEWCLPETENFKGLIVERSKFCPDDGKQYHALVKEIANLESVKRADKDVGQIWTNVEKIKTDLPEVEKLIRENTKRLVAPMLSIESREEASKLADKIIQDAVDIAINLVKGHPDVKDLVLRLEVIGENRCFRWHRDDYVGRAIVTYNGPGTDYLEDENINWENMKSADKNDQTPIDPSLKRQIKAGDMMFMRGCQSKAGGLVHRSPMPIFWPDEAVIDRLILKVDIPEKFPKQESVAVKRVRVERAPVKTVRVERSSGSKRVRVQRSWK